MRQLGTNVFLVFAHHRLVEVSEREESDLLRVNSRKPVALPERAKHVAAHLLVSFGVEF